MSLLLSPTRLGPLQLQNRIAMSPMTRCRAIDNVPNELMAQYYSQRASVGLIITEGTSPSANGLGYARIPGLFSQEQVAGWRLTTDAVHAKGARIVPQLMHCGRVSHPLNMARGSRVLAPSAVAAKGEMWTDSEGMKPLPVPEAMTEADIKQTIDDFVTASRNGIAAGFDGIELHAANGYLLEQFLRPNSNIRDDAYGGSTEKRARFVLELADAVIRAIGKEKVGIRISPFGTFNDMPLYPEMEADYAYLAGQLNERGLLYIHVVDHSSTGAPKVPDSIKATIRKASNCHVILSGGYDRVRAEADLQANRADLIAFAKAVLANPDLVKRWQTGAALNTPDPATFYTPGEKGYTDYPALGFSSAIVPG
jgi:N-ethylmaleimide reductase